MASPNDMPSAVGKEQIFGPSLVLRSVQISTDLTSEPLPISKAMPPPRLIYEVRREERAKKKRSCGKTGTSRGASGANVTDLGKSFSKGEHLAKVQPFVLPKDYSPVGNEIEFLQQERSLWQGLGSEQPEGESGFNDPSKAVTEALLHLRHAFSLISVSTMSMASRINNSVPSSELTRALNSLNHVNHLLTETRVELESTKVEVTNLRSQLDEAKALLADPEFLANEFKKTEEYTSMRNEIMGYGVAWCIKRLSKHYPEIDFSFLYEEFVAFCRDPDAFSDTDESIGGN